MNCDACGSDRVISVSGKCNDMCNVAYKGMELNDYVPRDMGIGGGDYMEFSYCLECGKIQGNFPIENPQWYQATKDEDDIEKELEDD
jgi:hypothetical protein